MVFCSFMSFGVLEQLVPVVLDAVFLLDEGDGVLEYLGGIGCAPGSLWIMASVTGKSGRFTRRRWIMEVHSEALQGMLVVRKALPIMGKASSIATPVSAAQREQTSAGRPKDSATSI